MPLTARSYQTKKQDTSGSQAKWNHGYLPVDMSWRNGYFCFTCRNSIAKVQCVELFVPLRCYLYRTMVCPSSLERALHFPRWVWNTLEKIGCLNVIQNKSVAEKKRDQEASTAILLLFCLHVDVHFYGDNCLVFQAHLRYCIRIEQGSLMDNRTVFGQFIVLRLWCL